MPSPPAPIATSNDRLPVSGGGTLANPQAAQIMGVLAQMAREVLCGEGLDVSRREALRIAVEFTESFEADRLAALLRRGKQARVELAAELREWARTRRRKLFATDTRLGGPNWRLTT